jgi:hypothetical protein
MHIVARFVVLRCVVRSCLSACVCCVAPAPGNDSGSRHPGRYQRRPSVALHSASSASASASSISFTHARPRPPTLLAAHARSSHVLHTTFARLLSLRACNLYRPKQIGVGWPIAVFNSQFPAAETLQGAVCVHGQAHGLDAAHRLPALLFS